MCCKRNVLRLRHLAMFSDLDGTGGSVPDPWHFGTEPNADPDPQESDSYLWLIIRLRIQLLQEANKFQQIFVFYAFSYLKIVNLHHPSKIKNLLSHETVEIKVFLQLFCLLMARSGSGAVQTNYGSGFGSRRPRNIRIRIRLRNTGNRIGLGLLTGSRKTKWFIQRRKKSNFMFAELEVVTRGLQLQFFFN